MRVYVQWTRAHPRDLEPLDSRAWRERPRRALPLGGETIDDSEGWIYSLNVQGVVFEGFDHYAVEHLPGGGCGVTVWNDDPEDFAEGERFAQVWEFRPPAPDERIGGRMNTRQRLTLYADDPSRFPQSDIMDAPCRPWSEFTPPPEEATRHGIWVSDAKAREHQRRRSLHGWREWVDG